jgi:hypothetical protein
VDLADLRQQDLVAQCPVAGRALLGGAVTAGGDEPTLCRTQGAADELDPELIAIGIDVGDHLVVGRSSSAAKNADAVFRIGGFNRWSQRVL